MKTRRNHVLLHGGGFDSTALFALLSAPDQLQKEMLLLYGIESFPFEDGTELNVVHINYGHLAGPAEALAISDQLSSTYRNFGYSSNITYTQLTFPNLFHAEDRIKCQLFTGNHGDSPELPGRNSLLMTTVLDHFQDTGRPITDLWLGADPVAEGTTPMADCTKEFFDTQSALRGVKIHTPFLDSLDRPRYEKMLAHLLSLNPVMVHYMTCWTPINEEPCGECSHCLKAIGLHAAAGALD